MQEEAAEVAPEWACLQELFLPTGQLSPDSARRASTHPLLDLDPERPS